MRFGSLFSGIGGFDLGLERAGLECAWQVEIDRNCNAVLDGHLLPSQFGVRRLTPRECERLQGFPKDWTRWRADGSEIADSPRYQMIGNAVAVPVARAIGVRLSRSQEGKEK